MNGHHKALTFPALLAAILLLAACGLGTAVESERPNANTRAADGRSYEVRGRILEVRDGGRKVLIQHEAMPGYMPAMTMRFSLQKSLDTGGPGPGDAVSFRYVVTPDSSWAEDFTLLDPAEANGLMLAEEPEISEASDVSLYQLEGAWTNQHERKMTLSAFAGRPVVLSMVFTNCGYACPMIVTNMKRIEVGLPDSLRDRTQFVLVSLDPDRDTPAALRRFARTYELNETRWTLLRSESDQVRMLAAMLGLRYREQADGQFAHTSRISILDEDGEIVHQQNLRGTNDGVSTVLMDLLADAGGH